MFDKPITEMTLEEIDAMVEEYFNNVDKIELLFGLLEAGFKPNEINFSYFFDSVIDEGTRGEFHDNKTHNFFPKKLNGLEVAA